VKATGEVYILSCIKYEWNLRGSGEEDRSQVPVGKEDLLDPEIAGYMYVSFRFFRNSECVGRAARRSQDGLGDKRNHGGARSGG